MLDISLRNKIKSNKIPYKSLSLNPTKDDFINIYSPDETYNLSNIQVYNGGPLDSLYGLLYFDLSSIINKTIINAVLSMYADDLSNETIIGIKRITSSWTEGVVTWNTKPTISETVYYEESVPIGSGEWKTFGIQSLIQAIADGASYEGIWLYVGNNYTDYRWCQFSSKEGDNKPVLEIKYY
jgi:hypothetical protein